MIFLLDGARPLLLFGILILILIGGLMEEAILLYRDAYGICRFTGLSRSDLATKGVYVGDDIEFGFTSYFDLMAEYQRPSGAPTAALLKDNPAYRLYRELTAAGKAINHTTLDKCHFYSVLAEGNAAR